MKSILRKLRAFGLIILDWVVCTIAKPCPSGAVLLIRVDAIGDFILWLNTAKEYRRLYPDCKITLIGNAAWADLAQALPYWDEVWSVDLCKLIRNPFYRWKLLRKISRAGFSVAIQPTFSRVFLYGDSLARASGAPQRIASTGNLNNISAHDKAVSDHWFTHLAPATPRHLMELERNAEFISYLSGEPFNASLPVLPPLITLPARLRPAADYFIVFPGASSYIRQWPEESFAQVLTQLNYRYGWLPVLCGAPSEFVLCQSVKKKARVESLNLSGETTLVEFAELIRGACLLVGNDTSAVHLAVAVGTPAVCILGGGHYGQFMPYPEILDGLKPLVAAHKMPCYCCNWHCSHPHNPNGPVPCITGVSVETVLAQTVRAIDQANQALYENMLTSKPPRTPSAAPPAPAFQ